MSKVRRILVAVDQFPQSKAALARALEFARAHDARLTIVHIVDERDAQSAQELGATEKRRIERQALSFARKRVEDAIRAHDPGRIELDLRVEAGSPSARVVEIAHDLGVDLVVLRAHQRRSIREQVLGSTADRIIRATSSSVLVVKRPVERAYRNVVVAVEFSDVSQTTAILSAGMCPGVRLHLVHVTHVSLQFEQAMLRAGTSQAKMLAFRRTLATQARDRLRRLAARFTGCEHPPRTRVMEGDPARSLVRLTSSAGVDLIALGPYEHGVIRLALLGSVTQHLLREAGCDVLISRPHPATT